MSIYKKVSNGKNIIKGRKIYIYIGKDEKV
jgi:hypothetical protein